MTSFPAHRLPAHRYEERKKAADKNAAKTWAFDYDESITAAPKQLTRIAEGLKALGDRVVVVTGNDSPRANLVTALDDLGFPYDALIQYEADTTFGIRRADILRELDAFGAFDDRAGRAVTLAKVCPHFFVSAEPPKAAEDAAKGGKKAAKQAIQDAGL